jgi:hypothetical protein
VRSYLCPFTNSTCKGGGNEFPVRVICPGSRVPRRPILSPLAPAWHAVLCGTLACRSHSRSTTPGLSVAVRALGCVLWRRAPPLCGVGGIPGQAAAPGAVTPRGHGRTRLPDGPSQPGGGLTQHARVQDGGLCPAWPLQAAAGTHGRRTPVRPSKPQRSQPSGPGGGGRTASCPSHLSAFCPSICPLSSRELGLHSSACAQGLLMEQQTSGKGGVQTPHH